MVLSFKSQHIECWASMNSILEKTLFIDMWLGLDYNCFQQVLCKFLPALPFFSERVWTAADWKFPLSERKAGFDDLRGRTYPALLEGWAGTTSEGDERSNDCQRDIHCHSAIHHQSLGIQEWRWKETPWGADHWIEHIWGKCGDRMGWNGLFWVNAFQMPCKHVQWIGLGRIEAGTIGFI